MSVKDALATAYMAVVPQIDKAEEDALVQKLGDISTKASASLQRGLTSALRVAGQAARTALDGFAKLAKSSLSAYGETEQLVGGIKKVFFDESAILDYSDDAFKNTGMAFAQHSKAVAAIQIVLDNAARAYKTAGMSANQYMQSVMGISTALLASGVSAEEAAKIADQAMRDISDNANTFGVKTAEELTMVYTALARGNYTLLDNLSLGYAGSQEGMQKLIEKANEWKKAHGQAGTLALGNMADMIEAIHIVQDEIGITGTTEKEASETIQGSLVQLGATWENFVAGLGDPEADVKELLENVMMAFDQVVQNVMPTIEQIAKAFVENLPELLSKIEEVATAIQPVIEQTVPKIVEYIGKIFLTKENIDAMVGIGLQLGQALIAGVFRAVGAEGFASMVEGTWWDTYVAPKKDLNNYSIAGKDSEGTNIMSTRSNMSIGTINITADSQSTVDSLAAKFRQAKAMA